MENSASVTLHLTKERTSQSAGGGFGSLSAAGQFLEGHRSLFFFPRSLCYYAPFFETLECTGFVTISPLCSYIKWSC